MLPILQSMDRMEVAHLHDNTEEPLLHQSTESVLCSGGVHGTNGLDCGPFC